MKTVLVSVFDKKLEAFGRVAHAQTLGVAIRSFEDACKGSEAGFSDHPEDFDLHHVGEFDDTTGLVRPVTPQVVARAVDYVRKGG